MLALDNHNGINLANHTKQGLVDGIGQLSHTLLRTAMNEDVLDLKEKFNQLTFASAQNKLIHLNSKNIKRIEQQVQDVASYADILRPSLSAVLIDIKNLNSINVLE